MQKKIIFEKGILIIGYCDNSQDISVYRSGEYTEPIRFTFIPNPNIQMTENSCIEYTNGIMPRIIEEAQSIISTNNEFYQNFDIDLKSDFSGFNLDRHSLNRDLLIVRNSWMHLKCKLIE
jgi:hypothetical protein